MSLSKIDEFVKEVKQTKKIDIAKWKEFKVSKLFEIELSKGDNQAKSLIEGNIPLISAGNFNNGVCKFIKTGDVGSNIFPQNTLTVDMFGKSFYQNEDYYAVSHGRINILKPKFKLTKNIGLFLVGVFDSTFTKKYSFSTMCSQSVLKGETIKLPADKYDEPDWEYMENYIETLSLSNKKLNLDKLEELPKKIKNETKINVSKWKKFKLIELFNYKRGKRYKKGDHKTGYISYVSSSAKNNGIDNLVNPPSKLKIYENCITLANSGSVGTCFYHNYKFVASDHVHVLWLKNRDLKREIALFLIATIERNKDKFMFNKEISENTIEEIDFLLPTKNNEPNWEYMDEYITNISKKIETALR